MRDDEGAVLARRLDPVDERVTTVFDAAVGGEAPAEPGAVPRVVAPGPDRAAIVASATRPPRPTSAAPVVSGPCQAHVGGSGEERLVPAGRARERGER